MARKTLVLNFDEYCVFIVLKEQSKLIWDKVKSNKYKLNSKVLN